MEQRKAEMKMGVSSNEKRKTQISSEPRKGGLRTLPFIIVNESFEKLASYGLMPNMILYLMKGYNMETVIGTRILFLWSAMSNAMAIFGAFLSDSYLGRFRVIALGSFSSLFGMTLLWLTAMIPELKPPPCDQFIQACSSATSTQLAILFSSFGLMSIGAGCIRPCSIAFGADQLDSKENPNNERLLQSYFNWYYASVGISTVVAMTIIVYIQDQLGWKLGLAVPAVLMVFSALVFLLGSSFYVKVKPSKSLFTGWIQVLVAAFKNRKLILPHSNSDQLYHSLDSKFSSPTNSLRCLNKACLIRDPREDIDDEGSAVDPWNLCTVEQVESLKSLLRVIPMWSTGIIILVTLNQKPFSTLQANTMNRHLFSNLEIPAGSFTVVMVITLTLWIAFYDRFLMPLLAKYTGKPRGLTTTTRMGIGLLLSCAALALSAITESERRRIAIQEGFEDLPNAVIYMSAMWLVPQYALLGVAEAFTAIGQLEFFYREFPKSMSSVAVALFTLGLAVADLVGSVVVDVVDSVTSRGGKESWLSSNLNKGHLDYYYWLLTGLSSLNFIYFLVCCWAHGASDEDHEVQSEYRALPSA